MLNSVDRKRLRIFAATAAKYRSQVAELTLKDSPHLDESSRKGLIRVLSSITTSEGYEGQVLEPMIAGFVDKDVREYLRAHAEDEECHHTLLKTYLQESFAYRKSQPTTADKIIYSTLLPWCERLLRARPFLGILALYVYEIFSVSLYQRLLAKCDEYHLPQLARLIGRIIRDEKRHIAALETLMSVFYAQSRWYRLSTRILAWPILGIVRLDLNMGRLGFLNRELQQHFRLLAIDPLAIDADSRAAVFQSKGLLSRKFASGRLAART